MLGEEQGMYAMLLCQSQESEVCSSTVNSLNLSGKLSAVIAKVVDFFKSLRTDEIAVVSLHG